MNLQHIITEIEKTDTEFLNKVDSRRNTIKNFNRFIGKVSLVALPFALGGLFKKANGQSTSGIIDVLNYALTLE